MLNKHLISDLLVKIRSIRDRGELSVDDLQALDQVIELLEEMEQSKLSNGERLELLGKALGVVMRIIEVADMFNLMDVFGRS